MRQVVLVVLLLALFTVLPSSTFAQRGDVFDAGVFYTPLSPYGEWVNLPPFGWVWAPYDVPPDWRPYTVGRWIWSDCGWTWVSYEPWGWATDHYGRWYFDPYYGWVWVPGTEWAPAWVAWRYGSGWIGWTPLPPAFVCRPGVGFSNPTMLGPQVFRRFGWCFVESSQFCNPNLRPYIARPVRNVNILHLTSDVTRYDYSDQRWFNRGVDVGLVERAIQKKVPAYRVVASDRMVGSNGMDLGGKDLRIYRPKSSDLRSRTIIPPQPKPPKTVTISPEIQSRQDAERRALEQRLAAERQALEDRQRRESGRLIKQMTPDQLRAWQAREVDAFNDQITRERNLIQRYQERERTGKVGAGQPQSRKYRFGSALSPTTQPVKRH